MINGLFIDSDLSRRRVSFQKDDAAQFLHGTSPESVEVVFKEGGTRLSALFGPEARAHEMAPNPVVSLGVNRARTGNSAFFTDPTSGVCGPAVIVARDGRDLTDEEVEEVEDGVRAAQHYCQDFPDEFVLWRNAVRNLGRMDR